MHPTIAGGVGKEVLGAAGGISLIADAACKNSSPPPSAAVAGRVPHGDPGAGRRLAERLVF